MMKQKRRSQRRAHGKAHTDANFKYFTPDDVLNGKILFMVGKLLKSYGIFLTNYKSLEKKV